MPCGTSHAWLLVLLWAFADAACAEGAAAGARRVAQEPRIADPLKDVAITVSVKQLLSKDPTLAGTVIDVETAAGIVTLQGRVPELAMREHATRLVQAVYGVVQVNNRLTVTRALG